MTHTYNVSGMTCNNCQNQVTEILSGIKNVRKVHVDLKKGNATVDMAEHIPVTVFQNALRPFPKFHLSEVTNSSTNLENKPDDPEIPDSWFQTYKPILLIFGYITVITVMIELMNLPFEGMRWMRHFMAGFFLSFSFFKLINLKGFAESYSTYDIIAKRWKGWGYVYAFIELALGLAYLSGYSQLLVSVVTLVVMSVSIVGVLQSVLNRRKIKCACLGAVFNLPMSTITIIEDALMILMSLVMIITLI